MSLLEHVQSAGRVFLDSAPLIYFVENHPRYAELLAGVFAAIDDGKVAAVTSPVTLAECLIHPLLKGDDALAATFEQRIVNGYGTTFLPIDGDAARIAARLRAQFKFALMDALQLGAAISAGCGSFLTNDLALRRVTEIEIVVLESYASA